ncbi:MAG: hypothetical protein WCK11_05830 [Candidatus Falkowbacteria bacterium]
MNESARNWVIFGVFIVFIETWIVFSAWQSVVPPTDYSVVEDMLAVRKASTTANKQAIAPENSAIPGGDTPGQLSINSITDPDALKFYTELKNMSQKDIDYLVDGWLEFKNKKYKISFKHDVTWQHKPKTANSGIIEPMFNENCFTVVKVKTCLDKVIYEVMKNPNKLSITEFLAKLGWRENVDYRALKERDIKGAKAFELISISAEDNTESRDLWVPLPDGNFFRIVGTGLVPTQQIEFGWLLDTVTIGK